MPKRRNEQWNNTVIANDGWRNAVGLWCWGDGNSGHGWYHCPQALRLLEATSRLRLWLLRYQQELFLWDVCSFVGRRGLHR